jgi:hypothetical protein
MQRLFSRILTGLAIVWCIYFLASSFLTPAPSPDADDGCSVQSNTKKPQSIMMLRGITKRVLEFNR